MVKKGREVFGLKAVVGDSRFESRDGRRDGGGES
jgi:hypothetical protein